MSPISSARGTRTLFAGLYGELTPRLGLPELAMDAYGLFYGRSVALGWLTEAREGASGGLWGMNDAEVSFGSGQLPRRVAFFQVVLTEPTPDSLLPVQAFLACAGDTVARLGDLRLSAVQLLLPRRGPPEAGIVRSKTGARVSRPLVKSLIWFGDGDARVPVRVTLDGGTDPSVHDAADKIFHWAREIQQDVFVADSLSLDEGHLVLDQPPLDPPEMVYAHHRITLKGMLAEWSLDALGWLASFLADGSTRNGVGGSLLLSADRD